MTSGFWQDRPTLVTGATGLVGGWLVKRLRAAGASVVCTGAVSGGGASETVSRAVASAEPPGPCAVRW